MIVLNWNGWNDTMNCLRRLGEVSSENPIWLIDNNSKIDRTAECLEILPSLRIVRLSDNFGWSGGYNRALVIALSEGFEWVYLLNNDALPLEGFLQQAKDAMMSDPQSAAVGSIIMYADDQSIKFDGVYYLRGEKADRLLDRRQPYAAQEVNGAGMLVRLKAFESLGGFDERFFCYAEETEWCYRAIRQGWRLMIAPLSVILHSGEGSDVNSNARYYRLRNQFLLELLTPRLERRANTIKNVRQILNQASAYRRRDDKTGYAAMQAALRDGLMRRFGKRRDEPVGIGFKALVFGYSYLYNNLRFHDSAKR